MANEKIETYQEAARVVHLWLKEFCNEKMIYPDMIAEAARQAAKEIERLRKPTPKNTSETKKWRLIDKAWIKGQFQWEPRDLWVGIFWRKNYEMPNPFCTLHIYICLIPLLPFHITLLLKSETTLKQRAAKGRE